MSQGLFDLVFIDFEMVLFQPQYIPVQRIGHGDPDNDRVDVHTKPSIEPSVFS